MTDEAKKNIYIILVIISILLSILFCGIWINNPNQRLEKLFNRSTKVLLVDGALNGKYRGDEAVLKRYVSKAAKKELYPKIKCKSFSWLRMNRDMCNGNPHMLFFKNTECIAHISIHHCRMLRWRGKYHNDITLTRESGEMLEEYFESIGLEEKYYK